MQNIPLRVTGVLYYKANWVFKRINCPRSWVGFGFAVLQISAMKIGNY